MFTFYRRSNGFNKSYPAEKNKAASGKHLIKWMHIRNTCIWRIAVASTVDWQIPGNDKSEPQRDHLWCGHQCMWEVLAVAVGLAIVALTSIKFSKSPQTAGLRFGQFQAPMSVALSLAQKGWAGHDASATKTASFVHGACLAEAQSHLLRSNKLRFSSLPQDISPDLHVYNSTSLVTNRLLFQKSLSAQKPFGSFCLFWCIAIWFEWTSLNSVNSPDILMPICELKLRLAAFDRSSSWTMAIQLFSEMTSAKVQPDRHPVAFNESTRTLEMRREIPLDFQDLKIHRESRLTSDSSQLERGYSYNCVIGSCQQLSSQFSGPCFALPQAISKHLFGAMWNLAFPSDLG